MSNDIVVNVKKVPRHMLLLAKGAGARCLSAVEAQGLLDDEIQITEVAAYIYVFMKCLKHLSDLRPLLCYGDKSLECYTGSGD